MPSVRLLFGATQADPVGFDAALACDLAWVQACLVIQVPVPPLHHWVITVCQDRVLLTRLLVALCSTDRAARFPARAVVNLGIPFMPMLTNPGHSRTAASHIIMCSARVLVTELSSNSRVFGGKRVMLTKSFVGAVRTTCAIGSVTNFCLPLMRVVIWALIAYPPDLPAVFGCHDDVAKVVIPGGMPLMLQQWAELADVCTS